jgi:hypothetical protein
MATTPEGAVKKRIREVLKADADVWFTMPVPSGLGESTLDFLCAVRWKSVAIFFAIEAKAPKKKPTPRQQLMIDALRERNVKVFVIDGEQGISELSVWLEQVRCFSDS